MDARLAELARVFTWLGLTAFGGPAAHIAIMQRELVERRGWLSPRRFVDLLGLSSLLPGPTSTELALGIGFERARWRGLLVAGLGFILPASLLVLAIAVAYERLGDLAWARALLRGMAPVVVAVITHALLVLVSTALRDRLTRLVGVASLGLALVLEPLIVLAAGALTVLIVRGAGLRAVRDRLSALVIVPGVEPALQAAAGAAVLGLLPLLLLSLKLGLVVFGSGYVLVAFLGSELVAPGYITEGQLLDAIAIGQLTPGPVFTAVTFIGYLVAGLPGAIVATVGILLPSFVLVGATHPWLPRLRANVTVAAALDGLNAAAIGLIGAAVILLAGDAFLEDGGLDLVAAGLGVAALVALLSGRVGPVPLLVGGALVGLAAQGLRP